MVELAGFTFRYPRAERAALDHVDLTLPDGQFCAVIGANGAGKSTLCHSLAGFMPDFYRGQLAGSARVAGQDAVQLSPAELAGTVGLVFGNPFNQITGARYTVEAEIAFGLENLGLEPPEMMRRIEEVLHLTGLDDLGDRSPFALSGGQQQRLAIAAVLAMRPRLLVLDEPTAQLDPAGTREVFALLDALARAGGSTVILAEHKLEWVAVFADRVVVLHEGRIVADGPPQEVLAGPALGAAGLAPTRYTRVARRARELDLLAPDRPLPVTLRQALATFQ